MRNALAYQTYPEEEDYFLTEVSQEAEAKIANFHFQLASNGLKHIIANHKPA